MNQTGGQTLVDTGARTENTYTEPGQELDALLEGIVPTNGSSSMLAELHERPWQLIGIMQADSGESATETIAAFVRNTLSVPSVTISSDCVFVLASAEAVPGITNAVHSAKDLPPCTICPSLTFDTLAAAPKQYELVMRSISACRRGAEGNMDTRVLELIKDEIADNTDLSSLLHPALEKLRKYDDENQSNMYETLRVYLANDRNAQRCASILYLHRNSLQYRIRRIQDIAGVDLNNPAERAWLRLSLFISS